MTQGGPCLGRALSERICSGAHVVAGITARRIDSTGSGIFPAQAADAVLESAGLDAWPGAASSSAANPDAAGAERGTGGGDHAGPAAAQGGAETGARAGPSTLSSGPVTSIPEVEPVAKPPGNGGTARGAQEPTFDAIFDDILAS